MNEPQRTERRIEIVHESLLTKWPRLVHWQTQDAEGAQLRDELRQAALLWDQHGRLQDFLWSGTAFGEFRVWRERYPGGLSAVEAEFARAMEVSNKRRRRRRRAAVATLLAAAALVAVVTSVLWQRAVASREQAEAEALRSEASKLVVLGERELETYPTAALAYAIKSLEVADTEPGRLLALRVLQKAPVARIATVGVGEADGAYALSLDFSPNGEWVATGGYTKSEVLHRGGQRRLLLGDYAAAGQRALAVRFTPRSDALVTNLLGEVRTWSIPEGRELRRGQIDHGTSSHLIMGDDEFVTFTFVDGKWVIRSWPLGQGEPHLLGTIDRFRAADLSAGKPFVVARDTKLYLQSLDDLETPPRIVGRDSSEVRFVALSPDGHLVAAQESSGTIRVWATESPSHEPSRVLEGEAEALGLRIRQQSRWLAECGMPDGRPTIRLWDLEAPPRVDPITLRRSDPQYLNEAVFDSEGRWLATAHANDVALWWLGGDYPRVFRGVGGGSVAVFTPDGQSLISASRADVRIWPLAVRPDAEPRILFEGTLSSNPGIAIDAQGRNIVVAGARGRIHLVPLDGSPARQLEGFPARVEQHAVAFSPDGRLVAAAPYIGPAEEKVIRVFDLETGAVQVLAPVPGVGEGFGGVQSLVFVGSNRILAGLVMGDPAPNLGIVSFDLETGVASVLDPPLASVDFNHAGTGGVGLRNTDPDADAGVRPVRGSYEAIQFRLDGTARETLPGRSTYGRAAFDPSDRILATSDDLVIRVGPVAGGEPHLLMGHTGLVTSLVFSPDGRLLASAGADDTIRVWRVPDLSKPPLHTLPLEELLSKLRTHTNLRAVPDPTSSTGYTLEPGPFPGWVTPPEW